MLRCGILLERHGRFDDGVEDEEPSPQLVLASRTAPGGAAFVEDPLPPLCARRDGFSLHAGAATHANDRKGLERLCRYGLRPPLALCRLAASPDGIVTYEMKRQFSDRRRVLRITAREFLLRLCALVPPRGFHMIRYAGIFSAHARGRYALTGRGTRDQSRESRHPPAPRSPNGGTADASAWAPVAGSAGSSDQAVQPLCSPLSASTIDPSEDAPDDAGRARRLTWAKLLKRVFAVDVLSCARCGGPMHVVAFIGEERVARRILEHLGLPARAPPRGPGRCGRQRMLPIGSADWDGIDPPLELD